MSPTRVSAPTTRPRLRSLRVTTGCRTCRRRHVKCDEGKPQCANCAKKDRTCEYDPPANGSETADSPAPVADTPARRPTSRPTLSTQQLDSQSPVLNGIRPLHDSQQLEAVQYSATTDAQTSAESYGSPFFSTLGSILLNLEEWNTAEKPPEDEPGGVLPTSEHLNNSLHNHWSAIPVIPVLYIDEQIRLSETEVVIYRNYVENVSNWVDSFSHDRPFRRLVSIWALRCPLLLHSCLALSSKQMVLAGNHAALHFDERTPLRYYRASLKMVRELLLHSQYAQSDEVLAACILLSTYEMIDVAGENLGSHLKGVASLLQSRQVQGDMRGIRGAAYWTWYRHEIWAALQTGRRISLNETYWEPHTAGPLDHLEVEDIANRALFILGQCINFSNGYGAGEDIEPDELLRLRHTRAVQLELALEEWQANRPPSMACFRIEPPVAGQPQDDLAGGFPTIWFVFPQSAIAHQVYHASKIILALHQPGLLHTPQGLAKCSSLSVRRQIERSREQIFLTANSGIPDAWSLVSAQCLYIAGLVTEGTHERKRTLKLIDDCQRRTGRKTRFIADELQRHWAQ